MRYWVVRWLSFFFVFVVFIGSTVGSAAGDRALGRPRHEVKYRFLAVGDSITQGAGAQGGYRAHLERRLLAEGYEVQFTGRMTDNSGAMRYPRHEGHGGWSTTDITDGRASEPTRTSLPSWLRYCRPNTVLVMTGTNDPIWVSRQEWAAKYEKLLRQIFAYDPATRVVLAAIPKSANAVTGKAWAEDVCYDIVRSVAARWKAQGYKVEFANTYTSFNPSTDLSDAYHPNARGYKKIADVLFSALKRME